MRPRRREAEGPRSDINVTPLVDVVLVLLIIFMVVTPMLQRGKEVDLPEATASRESRDVQEQLTISVTADGALWWEASPVADGELRQRLAALPPADRARPLVVKGDRAAKWGRLREVMTMANEAGFTRVGVVTEKPGQGG